MMVNQMSIKHDSKHKWTINEIYECVLPLFLVDEQNRGDDHFDGEVKGKRKGGSGDAGTRAKMARTSTGYFCARHGGENATHNTAECRSRLKSFGSENKPNRATTAAVAPGRTSSSSSNSLCNYCHKPRAYGHKCQEFYDWKRERESRKNINVHTVQAISESKAGGSGSGPDVAVMSDTAGESSTSLTTKSPEDIEMAELDKYLDEIDAEDSSLNCKSNVSK